MSYAVHDLLKLPLLSEAKVVAGENGLKRSVKSVSFLEAPDSLNWVMPHDLLLTNAYLLYENPNLKKSFINELAAKDASAVAIKLNRYMQLIPEEMVEQANHASFPIIVLPFNVTPSQLIGTITKTLYSTKTSQKKSSDGIHADLLYDFFCELLFAKNFSQTMMLRRATSLGWDFTKSYSVILIQANDPNHVPKLLDIINNPNLVHDNYLFQYGRDIFLICDTTNQKDTKGFLKKYANEIRTKSQNEIPATDLLIAVGRPYNNLLDLPKSYAEAKKALSLEQWTDNENSIILFDDLGIYKILFQINNTEELEKYYQDTVAKLEKYDQDNNSEYSKTMEAFVKSNGNFNETAKNLCVHYNTVKYRVNVINKILGFNVEDPEKRFDFQIGMKIGHLLNARK